MIYDKNNKYLRSFVINHKNTINTIYLVMLSKRFVKTFTPCHVSTTEVFAKISRDFQMICFYFEPKWFTGGFFLPSATNVFNFSIGTILQ